MGRASKTNEAMCTAVGADLAQMQPAFDKRMEDKYGKIRRALTEPPKDVNLPKLPLDQLKGKSRGRTKATTSRRWRYGVQPARAGDP